MTGKKWIVVTDKATGKVSLEDRDTYRPVEEKKTPMPDWVSDEPIRGKWRLVRDGDKYILIPYLQEVAYLHHVIQDTMEPLEVMATGEKFDSKSAYERRLKELGLTSTGGVKLSEISRKKEAERMVQHKREQIETFRETFEKLQSPSARKELLDEIRWKKENEWN